MQNIVSEITKKIGQSKIIKSEHKNDFDRYLNSLNKKTVTNNVIISEPQINDETNALILAAIYYLSDLNFYDYHLINYSFQYGLKVDDIIILLLLNNITDIDFFCKEKNLVLNEQQTIKTLKKLSALRKIQFNF
jgi:hypothetical protein